MKGPGTQKDLPWAQHPTKKGPETRSGVPLYTAPSFSKTEDCRNKSRNLNENANNKETNHVATQRPLAGVVEFSSHLTHLEPAVAVKQSFFISAS